MTFGNERETSDQGHAGFPDAAAPPLRKPVAWGGPIVMNTREVLQWAFDAL